VCLHCLNEKRLAARNRLYRTAARVVLGTIAAVAVMALIIGGIRSIKPSAPAGADASSPAATKTVQAGRSRAARSGASGARAALVPAIPVGRTELRDGMFAVRAADSVVVYFDTDTLRTRFDWKFESVVRATLPAIFPQAQPALAAIPQATFARGDLVGDLARRGIRLDLGDQGTLSILPLTRPGQDGPLVVAYRVTAAR
jgi:hypothetical protein